MQIMHNDCQPIHVLHSHVKQCVLLLIDVGRYTFSLLKFFFYPILSALRNIVLFPRNVSPIESSVVRVGSMKSGE